MGKVATISAIAGVGGTGAAGVYGAHKMGAFGGGRFTSKLDPVQTLSTLRTNTEGGCIGKGFGQVKEFLNVKDSSSFGSVSARDVKLGNKTPSGISGCLYVNWSKTKNQSNALEGNLEIIWATWGGSTGFLVYLKGNTQGEKAMAFDGIAYIFEKNGQGWKPTKKMSASPTSNVLSGKDLLEKFPKKGNMFVGGATVDDYWNFLDVEGNVKEIGGKESESGKYSYTWADGVDNAGTDMNLWSSNMDKWWGYFFDGSNWNMSQTLNGIRGTWSHG